ncbi:NADH-quinone oxidoreductase subunit K [Streptosporangium subroseum]|uniref:NADH-quinone oxidoreductase subunit K n=1 Tax=Streptosporangium subroseum TaxID=106412 RepID=A0A239P9X0_9ACTN|nr:NADH-quinone oxidoreductase subunit NuoK [Streptosporangium subroseum]SNT63368.1 NADH-quinone oxidoreductase subunit K [Streptosporangium subroseum]
MHVVYPTVVSALLFSIGVYGVLARRNTILVLMSVELMLNAVNLNLVVFDVWLRDRLHGGQVLTLFVIVIAAAEVGLGLAIILALYRNRQTIDLDRLRTLTEPTDSGTDPEGGSAPDASSNAPTPGPGPDAGPARGAAPAGSPSGTVSPGNLLNSAADRAQTNSEPIIRPGDTS